MHGVNPDTEVLNHFSEVGIVLLLFMAGLEVEIDAFLKSWKQVLIIGMGQIVLCTALYGILALGILPWIEAKTTAQSVVYFGLCMTFFIHDSRPRVPKNDKVDEYHIRSTLPGNARAPRRCIRAWYCGAKRARR